MTPRYCDNLRRRDFLRAGILGAAGLSLADYLALAEAGELRGGKATSAIFLNLVGGPTHVDTFDMKPDAPAEWRGELRPIETNASGMQICELLPRLAKCGDKFALLRGVSHTLTEHQMGTKYVNTGNRPLPSLEFPGYGAMVSKELQSPPDLPPFVAIPRTAQVAGVLGVEYAPFNTQTTPRAGQPYSVRGITLGPEQSVDKLKRRQQLLADLDATLRRQESSSSLLRGMDRFSRRAHEILVSPRAARAFDISQEQPSVAKLFPGDSLSQSCLLGMRLVEAGVRFVSIEQGGWDTHDFMFRDLRGKLMPELDGALSGLLTALDTKGLLATTAVFVTGEFGRSPKISSDRVGRDHYPRAMFMLLAGGGIKGGQVIGATDARAEAPLDGKGMSPDDVAASFYHALGIDARKEYRTPTGRPVAIVRNGTVIKELFG